jgi:uncharacterized protein (TIGR03437 family)
MKVFPPSHPVSARLLLILTFFVVVPAFAQTKLIPTGSSWNYLDDGSDQGIAWRAASFNDSAWKSGAAKFGYGDGDEATVVGFGSSASHKHLTTYFRKSFTLATPAAFSAYRLRLLRDDGAIVYLNGQEVFRSNMPAGDALYTTPASAAVSGAEESRYFETTLRAAQLVAGQNVIAVEVHQASGSSSDLGFDLELTSETGIAVTRGPYLQMGTPNSVIVRWRTDAPTDSRVSFGSSPPQLNFSATELTLTTEHILKLSGLTPNTKYYYSIGTSSQPLAGGDDSHFFVTAPTTAKPTRIWVLGDAGTKTDAQRAVRDAYTRFTGARHTDLWLMLGDNAYLTGTDSEYQEAVYDMYPTYLRQSVLWPTIGNHDTGYSSTPSSDLPYYQMFTLPRQGEAGGLPSGTEDYYSFDYGNIHFVCLDSMISDRKPNSPMVRWLTNDLAANTKQWLIAFWHHPPYTKGSHDSDVETHEIEMRENVLPILESYGVDLVLTGHSHSYERSFLIDGHYGSSQTFSINHKKNGSSGRPGEGGAYTKSTFGPSAHEGAVYVVAGSSGQVSGGALNHPAMFISMSNLGSMALDVNGNRLEAKFLRETGVVADHFTIIKGGPTLTQAANTSAASFVRNHIAKEGLVSLFGANLCASAKVAATLPLPTTLNSTTVRVRDAAGQERAAPLLFVSPTQINYQIPPGTEAGTATITVVNGEVPVATETISIAPVAPGIFSADSSGRGWAAGSVQRIKNGVSTYEQVVQYDPALKQFVPLPIDLSAADEDVYLLLYGTGVRHRTATTNVKAQLNGTDVPVIYAAAQSQFVGVDQINVHLPRTLSGRGEVTLSLVVDGKPANPVKLKIK